MTTENRIEELIKEKGYTLTTLAAEMGTTKQNLYGKLKSPSYPTLVEIATALNVPMWQLFASPEEAKGEELTALIQHKSEYYKATSVDELKKIISEIEEK